MSAPSPAHDLVGAVLNGRWRLVRLLGEGGMGAVFEADGAPGVGKRAIKLLHQEYVREEQILARFFTEAQATRTLNHPNVAQVLETGTAENGTPYLVMELLQGVPVSSYVDQGQALPPPQAVHIVHGVLQALAAAHYRSVIHRDIKPDNLFLVHDANGSFHAKVLDFGIAKVMDVAGGMGHKTRTGVLLGTPGYMSPEQIKNSKGVDARSDLWSVGIIFYELLTGTSPFPAGNDFARLTSVLTEEMTPIEQVAPHLASWSGFFRRALAKDPAWRFQSADEMASALLATSRGPSSPASGLYPSSMQPPSSLMVSSAMITQHSSLMRSPAAQQLSGMMTAPSMQHVAAVSQGSIPPPPRSGPIASTPPSEVLAHAADNAVNVGPTHVSALNPPGTAMARGAHGHAPSIEVIDGSSRRGGVSWVVVGVIAAVALGLGFALGILIG
jgi:serine/threonine protein kinase